MSPKKNGRPTKKTPASVSILIKALEDGMPLDRACDFALLNRATVYRWIGADPAFATKVRWARSAVVRKLIREVRFKDPWKILRALDPKNFSDEVTFRELDEERDEEMEKLSDEEVQRGAR